jgi:Short C-terminal domain
MTNDDPVGQLKKLSDLRAQGILSEAEFTAAKAKVIGSTETANTGVTPTGAACGLAFGAAIIGSIGPWATSPLSSASGFQGDGKITAVAAVIGLAAIATKRTGLATLAALVALAVGVYDAIHIHDRLRSVTLFGAQVDHVGWGVYVVIIGAAVAAVGAYKSRTRDDKPAIDATPAVRP